MLVVAGFLIWGDIAIAGVVLIILTLLIVLVDSWTNRPIKKSAPPYRENRRDPRTSTADGPARGAVSRQVGRPAPGRNQPPVSRPAPGRNQPTGR